MLAEGVSLIESRSPKVVLEPNPTYWNPDRKPSVRIVYDNAISKVDAIKSVADGDGTIDVVFDLTPEEAHAFKSDVAKVQTKPAKAIVAGVFNENKPASPWTNPALRRAVNMALDRHALVEAVHGYGEVIPAFIQPGRYGFCEKLKPYVMDLTAAKAAVETHGMSGKEVVIVTSPTYAKIVEAIATQFASIGLTVKPVVTKETPPENWDIKLEWYFDWSPEYPVGVVHREFFGKSGILRQGPEDPAFDALYEKLLHTTMQPAQEEVVKEVERYIYDQAKCLFLYSPYTLFAVADRVAFTPYDTCMSELAETKIRA